jgi:hypothetical protein
LTETFVNVGTIPLKRDILRQVLAVSIKTLVPFRFCTSTLKF